MSNEAPTPWALGLVVTSSLCGVSSGNMQRSSSPASALANLFMDRDRWSRWIKLSEMTWNAINLGTRRHALSIWCQEEPTFERCRRTESQVSFKATDHHWHVRPPTLPELGPLLFGQWNDIFLHTHVTLLHMNHLKDRSAQHFQHLKFKMCEDWKFGTAICRLKSSASRCHFGGFQAREATGRLRPATPGGKHQTRFCRGSFRAWSFFEEKNLMLPKKTCKISIRSNAINVYSMSPVTSFPLVNSCRPAEFVAWKPQLQPAAELQPGQGLSKGAKRGRDIVML